MHEPQQLALTFVLADIAAKFLSVLEVDPIRGRVVTQS